MSPRRLAVPALLAAAPLLFFHEVWLAGSVFLLRDLHNWFYPWRTFAAASLARGDLPLWNPYAYIGTPFLGDMQSALLYPPNLPFWLLDFPDAMRVYVAIQLTIAAWLMYWMLRDQGCRPCSALTGAIGYAYGGWMIVHVEFPNKLGAAAWMPMIVLGLGRWWKGRRLEGLAIGSVAVACSAAAGYPQTTFTLLAGAGVVWCVSMVEAVRRPPARDSVRFPGRARGLLDTAGSLPAVVALGCLVAAAQVLPFLEAVKLSGAVGPYTVEQVVSLNLSPWHFLDLLLPHLFGLPGYDRYWGGSLYQYWLGHFYVGAATLALALVGACSRRAAAGGALALLAAATIFCLGDRTPFAPLVVAHVPGFIHFKWMPTTSLLIAFALCWLAAFGLDRLLDELEGVSARSRWIPIACAAVTTVAAVLGGVAWMATAAFERLVVWVVSHVALPAQLPQIPGHLEPARGDAVRAGVVFVLLAGLGWAARAGRIRPAAFAWAVPLVLFVDLKLAAADINATGDPALYRETPAIVERLRGRPDPFFRIYVPTETLGRDRLMYGSREPEHYRWASETLLFNLNLPWRIFSASDGDPIATPRWRRFHKMIEAGDDDVRGRLLSLANVGVILRATPDGGTEVADVPVYLPRVYVAAGARRVGSGDALAAMLAPGFDPALEVLVEEGSEDGPRAGETVSPGGVEPVAHTVHEVTYTNNTVTVEVEAGRAGYLILADASYPGWVATVDSRPARLFTANYLFRGLELPVGRHRIVYSYSPASVRWGVAGSVVGLIAVGVCLCRRRRASAASTA